jgi:hypothetical protein
MLSSARATFDLQLAFGANWLAAGLVGVQRGWVSTRMDEPALSVAVRECLLVTVLAENAVLPACLTAAVQGRCNTPA